MQRAKHADRKQRTRIKILIGEAVMRAGASHLPVGEIEAVLAHYVETGGGEAFQAFVRDRTGSATAETKPGGSAATRRGDVEVETLNRFESAQQ